MWHKLRFNSEILDSGVDRMISTGRVLAHSTNGKIVPNREALETRGNWLFFGHQTLLRDCGLWHGGWFNHFNHFVCEFCKLRCYKVVIKVHNFIEAIQFYNLMLARPFISGDLTTFSGKMGMDERHYSDGIFNCFIYCDGLDDALYRYSHIRAMVDEYMEDGEKIPIIVKRSCTEFERTHGPTDGDFWKAMTKEELDFQRHLEDIFNSELSCSVQPDWLKNKIIAKLARWANAVGDKSWVEYFGSDYLTMKAVTYHHLASKGDHQHDSSQD
jgi:hypothetical protein